MKVHLTFDIEIWCRGWSALDEQFPAAFERYTYGRSSAGEYALPKTLEILQRHGLTGVFFVEPLFAARFGVEWLERLVAPILAAGQDVQLHLHPEWTDEIRPPLLADVSRKRQHLTYYSADEQAALIRFGRTLLERVKGGPVQVFRAGSFAANRDTYRALAACGLGVDSSLNACYDHARGTLDDVPLHAEHTTIEGVDVYPVTIFRDGFRRARPAQVAGSSSAELRAALHGARAVQRGHFVIVSHNFEMLRAGSSAPDRTVARRFEALCRLLGEYRDDMPTAAFPAAGEPVGARNEARDAAPAVGLAPSALRLAEQLWRRIG